MSRTPVCQWPNHSRRVAASRPGSRCPSGTTAQANQLVRPPELGVMPKRRPSPQVSVMLPISPSTVPRQEEAPTYRARWRGPNSAVRAALLRPSAAITTSYEPSSAPRSSMRSPKVTSPAASCRRASRSGREMRRPTSPVRRFMASTSRVAIRPPSGRRKAPEVCGRLSERTCAPTPRASRAPSAVGHSPRAVPAVGRLRARSKTWTDQPLSRRERAVASPPMPPPTTAAVRCFRVMPARYYVCSRSALQT